MALPGLHLHRGRDQLVELLDCCNKVQPAQAKASLAPLTSAVCRSLKSWAGEFVLYNVKVRKGQGDSGGGCWQLGDFLQCELWFELKCWCRGSLSGLGVCVIWKVVLALRVQLSKCLGHFWKILKCILKFLSQASISSSVCQTTPSAQFLEYRPKGTTSHWKTQDICNLQAANPGWTAKFYFWAELL